jgi:hypothetical protein
VETREPWQCIDQGRRLGERPFTIAAHDE